MSYSDHDVAKRLDFHWRQVRDVIELYSTLILQRGVAKESTRGLQSALFDSFALRTRSLLEFLYFCQHRQYVRAADYRKAEQYGPGAMPDVLEKAFKSANSQVHHLTKEMVACKQSENWNLHEIVHALDAALQDLSAATNGRFCFERFGSSQ
jgi:hypothetical protein